VNDSETIKTLNYQLVNIYNNLNSFIVPSIQILQANFAFVLHISAYLAYAQEQASLLFLCYLNDC